MASRRMLAGATHIVSTANGTLVYDSRTGRALVVPLSAGGAQRWGTPLTLSTGWDTISRVGSHLFFYANGGYAALCHISPEGKLVQTQTFYLAQLGTWSHVVGTEENLFFYDTGSGAAAVARIDPVGGGRVVRTQSLPPGSLRRGWNSVASDGRRLLFHNRSTGDGAVGFIDSAGQFGVSEKYGLGRVVAPSASAAAVIATAR